MRKDDVEDNNFYRCWNFMWIFISKLPLFNCKLSCSSVVETSYCSSKKPRATRTEDALNLNVIGPPDRGCYCLQVKK